MSGDFFNFIQIGKVVDHNDPKKLGRVKIYIEGISDPTLESNPSGLPWAWQAAPTMFGGGYQQGSFSIPREGDTVFIFFLYGDIDYPIYFATFPCVQSNDLDPRKRLFKPNPPDWHSLSRGMPHQLEKDRIGTEDNIEYEAEYPHNTVISFSRKTGTTEGLNCTVEYDNTEGSERIQITHKKGSYLKFGKRGDISTKATENQYDTTAGDKFDYIQGNHEERIRLDELIVVDGNRDEFVGGNEIENVIGNKEEHVALNRTEETVLNRTEKTNVSQDDNVGVSHSRKVGAVKTEDVGATSIETIGGAKVINVPALIINASDVLITGQLRVNGLISSKTDVVGGPGPAVSLVGHPHPKVAPPIKTTSPLDAVPYTPVVPQPPQLGSAEPYVHPDYPLPGQVDEKNAPETIDNPEY